MNITFFRTSANQYELRNDFSMIGTFTFKNKWSYKDTEAQLGEDVWKFSYQGWDTQKIIVTDPKGTIVELKKSGFWNPIYTFEYNEKKYTLQCAGFWNPRLLWKDEATENILMTIQALWSWRKGKPAAHVISEEKISQEIMILAMIGFYRLKLNEIEASSMM
ncbi:MAG: hypothetical protein ACK4NC_04065 [Candidatus Gracilibacteria bacterium]